MNTPPSSNRRVRSACLTAAAVLLVSVPDIGGAASQEEEARNIIVFVADGWGYNQMEAASIHQFGWRGGQPYQRFPVHLATATFPYGGDYDPERAWGDFESFKSGATDSAASATALSTGVKTRNGRIGLGPDGERLTHMAEQAQKRDMSAGVVTSVQFSHATPASFIAHNESRGNYEEIALQMIEESGLDLIIGAGHPMYDNNGREVEEADCRYVGEELWNRIQEGEAGGDRRWTLIQSREEFQELKTGETPDRVLGIPTVLSTIQYYRSGNEDAEPFEVPFNDGVPTLVDMTLGALNVLSQNDQGFFLHVEGGAIDWAGHQNHSPRLIEELVDFDNTVEAVIEWIEENGSWDETLVVVTGDHETGYLTGPESGPDARPMWQPIENRGKGVLPGMEWHSPSHTNQLIPLFARGPGAERLREHVIAIDPERGPYVHITAVGKVGMSLLRD